MTRFAGLDVSVRETAVCVVDDAGKVLAERKVPSEVPTHCGLLAKT
jgi:transposase